MPDLPHIAQKSPSRAGGGGETHARCAFGQSKNRPFRDGRHKTASFTPKPFTAEKIGTVPRRGCKGSKNAPFCDGTHKTLG